MHLLQYVRDGGTRAVAVRDDSAAWRIEGFDTVLALAQHALASSKSLAEAAWQARGETLDLAALVEAGRLLAPIDHPDTAHCLLTGTGLTHLGSAEGRDKMHKAAASGDTTDSMRMFLMGVEGGKPADGEVGAQPEWFYKGDGSSLVGPYDNIAMPAFALDGSEEPEIAGIYLIDADGTPRRLGYTLANEFSDHITERGNYLWLAHSKLRSAALGPELLIGDLPDDVRGTSRVLRDGKPIWEKPFLTGEANMSHSLANLEAHHFKYAQFRRSGDIHVHFFGTATLSFADGVVTEPGDQFEIAAAPFSLPMRNRLVRSAAEVVTVVPL